MYLGVATVALILGMIFSPVSACAYEILEFDGYSNITVDSTLDIGTNVQNLTAGEIIKSTIPPESAFRKRREVPITFNAIRMITNTSYYDLQLVEDHYEVIVISCLLAGQSEDLEFVIDEETQGECSPWVLTVDVEASNPNITIPTAVNVSVDSCVPGTVLDVVQLQFNNDGNCSSWNCSANNTNDDKMFWIDDDKVLRTSADDVGFNFTYEVTVSCFDDEASDTSSDVTIDVTFIEAVTCTPTVIPSTTTALTTTASCGNPQQKSSGYFDNPDNVIFVSSIGGAALLLIAGVITYMVGKRYFCKTVR